MTTSKEGIYSMLITQNDQESEGQNVDYRSDDQHHGSLFTVKDGPRIRPYRFATGSLGLLCAVLMITTVALGVLYQNSYHLRSELERLASNHSAVTTAFERLQQEYRQALHAKGSTEEQVTVQRAELEELRSKLDTLQEEKKELQSVVAAHETSCGKCQPGWRLFKSKCYYFSYHESKTRRSWSDSRQYCVAQGTDLVVVDSEEKQVFISTIIESMGLQRMFGWHLTGFWMGLKDTHIEGTWKWQNGSELTVGYWMEGEPNDMFSDEDCVATYPKFNALKSWNDAPCNTLLNWICETEIKNN